MHDEWIRHNYDVEAIIENCRESKQPWGNAYRPAHLIHKNYLTTGEHYYPDKQWLKYGEKTIGYIRFLTPEVYPKCIWINKKIPFYEGDKITGYAIITKIYNNILRSNKEGEEAELNLLK